jgi:hypothetical protein
MVGANSGPGGIVVSSQAERRRPMTVKTFLNVAAGVAALFVR